VGKEESLVYVSKGVWFSFWVTHKANIISPQMARAASPIPLQKQVRIQCVSVYQATAPVDEAGRLLVFLQILDNP
jgi:hypothetical protein